MTLAHRDRLLEYALGQVLREPAHADRKQSGAAISDPAAEILAAWERGERASTPLEELDLELPDSTPRHLRSRSEPAPRERRLGMRLAAGLLVATGIAAALWQLPLPPLPLQAPGAPGAAGLEPARPDAFAEASRPLPSLTDPAAPPTTALVAGTRLSVEGTESVAVALAGGRLELSPGSIFSLRAEPPLLLLELGEVRVAGFADPFELEFASGIARVDPGTTLVARVTHDEARFLEQPADARAVLLSAGELARTIEFEVLTGSVALELGGEPLLLREPDSYLAWSTPSEAASPSGLDREWIYERFLTLADRESWGYSASSSFQGRNLADERARAAAAELSAFLETEPRAWAQLNRILIEASYDPPARRLDLLTFLARSDSPAALRSARSMWRRIPGSFSEDQLIAFAEAGGLEFEQELRGRVEVALADPALDLPSVRCAAYLARRGDDSGVLLLRAALQSEPDKGSLVDEYVAARGLEALGEARPWMELADRWARAALSGLERDPTQLGRRARWIASILALHDEPAESLAEWTSFSLWEAVEFERDGGPAELAAALEAHLLR